MKPVTGPGTHSDQLQVVPPVPVTMPQGLKEDEEGNWVLRTFCYFVLMVSHKSLHYGLLGSESRVPQGTP